MGTILTHRLGKLALLLSAALLVAACGDDSDDAAGGGNGSGEVPSIVVTTNILGDVTTQVVGEDNATIDTVMPPGADPHEFEPTARQAESMMDADLLVVNGAGFEEGLSDLIEQAEAAGVDTFVFADHISLIEGEDEHADEHSDEGEHADTDEHSDEEEHDDADEHGDEGEDEHADHGPEDPHIWTNPSRMVGAVEALGAALAELDGIDAGAVETQVGSYVAELEALDEEIETLLADLPEDDRVLVTNHEVLGYFADRYDFEVVGTVIPSSSTLAEPSSAQLDDLADTIRDHDVPAIFGETSAPTDLADSLAATVGDIEVVQLYSESLGDEGSGAETYVGMMRTNATLIADALA